MQYRRSNVPGACYFFTVNLEDRNKTLLVDHVDVLRQAIKKTKLAHSFDINAIVILPDHLHTIWTLPDSDADFPKRWRLIKSTFSRVLSTTEQISKSRINKGERGIWQRRYWEHLIKDENDYNQHVNYIHYNPVKHAYVESPSDWPYSSIHRYIRNGDLPSDWASVEVYEGGFGER